MGGEVEFDAKKTLYENAMKWVFSQGSSTVMLAAILAGGLYVMKYEVPNHIDKINAGYAAIEASNKATHLEIQSRDEAIHAKIESAFEKQTDRLIEAYKGK